MRYDVDAGPYKISQIRDKSVVCHLSTIIATYNKLN